MREIAVIRADYNYGEYEDCVHASISNWDEVSEEDFALLEAYINSKKWSGGPFHIIERVRDVPKLVADHIEECRKLKQQEEERKAKAKLTAQQKAEAKAAKDKAKFLEKASLLGFEVIEK